MIPNLPSLLPVDAQPSVLVALQQSSLQPTAEDGAVPAEASFRTLFDQAEIMIDQPAGSDAVAAIEQELSSENDLPDAEIGKTLPQGPGNPLPLAPREEVDLPRAAAQAPISSPSNETARPEAQNSSEAPIVRPSPRSVPTRVVADTAQEVPATNAGSDTARGEAAYTSAVQRPVPPASTHPVSSHETLASPSGDSQPDMGLAAASTPPTTRGLAGVLPREAGHTARLQNAVWVDAPVDSGIEGAIASQVRAPSPVPPQSAPVTVSEVATPQLARPMAMPVSDQVAQTLVTSIRAEVSQQANSDSAGPAAATPNPLASLTPASFPAIQASSMLSASGQPVTIMQSGTDQAAAPARQLEALIDNLVQARETGRSARGDLVLRHAEFGAVSIRLEHADGEMLARVNSRDPGFMPAAQAALAERAVSSISAPAESASQPRGHETNPQGQSQQSAARDGAAAQSGGDRQSRGQPAAQDRQQDTRPGSHEPRGSEPSPKQTQRGLLA